MPRHVTLVDASNVIGSRPDGWWRDRPAAARRLHARLARLHALRGEELVLVLEGAPVPTLPAETHAAVRVAWARRRGRDAADDRIVELLGELRAEGADVRVVTSDRALAGRVRAGGGSVEGAGAFLRRLDAVLPSGEVGETTGTEDGRP